VKVVIYIKSELYTYLPPRTENSILQRFTQD